MASYNCILIAPEFFGYGQAIQKAMTAHGLNALLFSDRPSEDTFTKSLIRISPRLAKSRSDAYFAAITSESKSHPIQEVLVIKGQALTTEAILRMRKAIPNARFTLYFWDSYLNMSRDAKTKVSLFDRTLTFDPGDAHRDARLEYRPLFYLSDYTEISPQPTDIDLLFVGTMHSDRYRIIKRIRDALPQTAAFSKNMYFVSPAVYQARRVFDPSYWGTKPSDFRFSPMTAQEIKHLLGRSRIVLDIERTVQSGLTIRTLETIAAGKKLITTNPYIAESDLYLPENILVIDRKSVVIPRDFLTTSFKPSSRAVMEKYSLDRWLADVLPGRVALPDLAFRMS